MKLTRLNLPSLALVIVLSSFSWKSCNAQEHPFARSIDGTIICNDVIREAGIFVDDNGVFRDDTQFVCLVDPTYTNDGSKFIELTMSNLPSSFMADRKKAQSAGNTRLRIMDATVERSTIILPDDIDVKSCDETVVIFGNDDSRQHEQQQQCFLSKLIWFAPDAQSQGQTSTQHSRKLAVNQTGNRSILVFRITTQTHGDPEASAADVSESIFGGGLDPVYIVSQFAACSNNKLTFSPLPADPDGMTASATGVYDISVTGENSESTATEIKNLVKAAVDSSFTDQADHVFYHMVSICKIHVALAFYYTRSREGISF
eukprot:scaffold11947_cov267-Chaetoceros_neogracile.AAC.1